MEWKTVTHKRKKKVGKKPGAVTNQEPKRSTGSADQDWEPVVFKKEIRRPVYTKTVARKQFQNEKNINAKKIEKAIEENTYELPKVSHQLKNQIMQARQAKKLSQTEFANRCKLNVGVIRDYESGRAVPNTNELNIMAKILDVNLIRK